MSLSLTEDQTMLRDTARSFFEGRSPLSRVRGLRDAGDPLGYSPELWRVMADLGFLGLALPEDYGGAALGLAEQVLVTEAMGRRLAPEPYLSAIALACPLLLASDAEHRQVHLPAIARGETRVAVAYREPHSRYQRSAVATVAARDGDDHLLSGQKVQVCGLRGADAVVVLARTAGQPNDLNGLSLFLLPADTPGLSVRPQARLDSRNLGLLQLDRARAPKGALLGALDGALPLLEDAIDRATVALCGEMLGGMSAAFEMTLDYLKARKQFDRHIGSFQALQHRAADLFMEIELSRTAVMHAARAVDGQDSRAAQAVSMAKARCGDAFIRVANEAIQMHGGIGMTDEHDIGFYLKRARVAEATFGDAAYHRDRWGTLAGF